MTRTARFMTLLVCCWLPLGFVAADTQKKAPQGMRMEHDLLGDKAVPANAHYGVQTARALENFQISGTSANMNANEVMANVGLELSGHKKGEYQHLEPPDDLNMSQSTNDSYPTAIKAAFLLRNAKLVEELQKLSKSFRAKGNQYLEIPKLGRTELQDAVPMTVGQEFHAFGASLESEIALLKDAEKYLYAVNMGATAIGSGINVPKGYSTAVAAELAKITGKPIVPATDMFAATWDQQGFVVYSAALRSVAIKLSKIASDLILLASGPRAGLNEINLRTTTTPLFAALSAASNPYAPQGTKAK